MRASATLLPILLAGLAAPASLAAQTLTGVVVDEYTGAGVAGVEVVLLDEGGDRVLSVEADSLGRYRFALPRPQAYVLATSRLGYEEGRTPLLDLSFEGTRTLDLVVTPRPVALAGFEVTVSAEEHLERTLSMFGVSSAHLPGSRIVTTEEIERVAGALDFAHVIQRQNIAGVHAVRRQDQAIGAPPTVCVIVDSGWSSGCALLVVDGAVTPRDARIQRATMIPPEMIEAMVVLEPNEASLVYGTAGGNGAVLIFTRARGWSRR